MIQTKYLIIIGAIVCLLILYYFYDEISRSRKLLLTTFNKTMALDAKVSDLEKKSNEIISKKKNNSKTDSPAMSLTYQSDMIRGGNALSVKYADISESEAKQMIQKITQNNQVPSFNQTTKHVPNGDFSDCKDPKDIFTNNQFDENTDTFHVKISNIIKEPVGKLDANTGCSQEPNTKTNLSDQHEYQKILNGLTNMQVDDAFGVESEIDQDIIKSISESLHLADMPSDVEISDIPNKPKSNKNTTKTK